MFKDKRIFFLLLLIGFLASLFWSQSRYPQLDDKAMMAGDMPTMGISFDILYPITASMSVGKKVLFNTLNWIHTNKKGMTFGLLLAAALLLLFHLLKDRQFENRYLNAAIGMLIGAPLGVCVNCAAPIAQGMKSAGSKTETALAAMISSPTFNVIILSMLFSMYPMYYVWIKLGLTVVLILLIIPVLSKIPTKASVVSDSLIQEKGRLMSWLTLDLQIQYLSSSASWSQSGAWVLKHYLSALWLMIKIALPLMLLAGILGNVLITFLPLEELVSYLPNGRRLLILIAIIGLATIGTFLPVPMTFDVIIVLSLMTAGLSARYALPLLFTLGSFSIYSYFIVHKSFSKLLALGLFLSVVSLGVIAGIVGHYIEAGVKQENAVLRKSIIDSGIKNSKEEDLLVLGNTYAVPSPKGYDVIKGNVKKINYLPIVTTGIENSQLSLSRSDLKVKDKDSDDWFDPVDHKDHGLIVPYNYSLYNSVDIPFSNQRSISVGDVHNDGWPDVLISSGSELVCYANLGNLKFERQSLKFKADFIISIALVDMNNDGWLDIFITTFMEGNYILYNNEGQFNEEKKSQPIDSLTLYSVAPAFGDLNRDGTLDYYLANSYGVQANRSLYSESINYGFYNESDSFKRFQIHNIGGVTHSNLMSDIDMDGDLDLIEGNDFGAPDFFMLNNGAGELKVVESRDSLIASTSATTMSYHSADLNNDLQPELLSVQHELKKSLIYSPEATVCAEIKDSLEFQKCIDIYQHFYGLIKSKLRTDFKYCPEDDLTGCIVANRAMSLMKTSGKPNSKLTPDRVRRLQPSWPYFEDYFLSADRTKARIKVKDSIHWIPQLGPRKWKGAFLLEKQGKDSTFRLAPEWKMDRTGWAWNAKAADLNNDGWQEVYIVNGFFFLNTKVSVDNNILYKNVEGRLMEDFSEESGLASPLVTSVFSYSDLDRDGDLDVVVVPEVGPTVIYENNNHHNNSLVFELRDHQGNHFGIGAKVFIYGSDGFQQYREILASGGFKSFDEPIAHFGLGKEKKIDKVVVQWSTGEIDTIEQDFEAGYVYRIERRS